MPNIADDGGLSVGQLTQLGGGAVSSLFGGVGSLASASAYETAAGLAKQNAQYAQISGRLQETQESRALYQSEGATGAEVAGAGFSLGGSAGDILRSSAQQGALAKQVISTQSNIQQQNFLGQAEADTEQANNAKTAAAGSFLSSAIDIGGALAELF